MGNFPFQPAIAAGALLSLTYMLASRLYLRHIWLSSFLVNKQSPGGNTTSGDTIIVAQSRPERQARYEPTKTLLSNLRGKVTPMTTATGV